jgi:hypothetical protein
MKAKARTLVLIAMVLGTSSEAKAADTARYRHCNVFADGVCFGIAAGDQLVHSIPVDYVLYEITLSSGTTLTIYNGMNPPRMSGYRSMREAKGKKWHAQLLQPVSGAGSRVFEITPSDRDVFRVTLPSELGPDAIDFLRNFRICTDGSALAIRCKNEFPLRDLVGVQ